MKEFYNLRSKVVHGNTSLEEDAKTKALVYDAELIILSITPRMLELNLQFTYAEISKGLNQALYHSASLIEILKGEK